MIRGIKGRRSQIAQLSAASKLVKTTWESNISNVLNTLRQATSKHNQIDIKKLFQTYLTLVLIYFYKTSMDLFLAKAWRIFSAEAQLNIKGQAKLN